MGLGETQQIEGPPLSTDARLAVLEANDKRIEKRIEDMAEKLDHLLLIAGVGRSAWLLILKLGAVSGSIAAAVYYGAKLWRGQ